MTKKELSKAKAIYINNEILMIIEFYPDEIADDGDDDSIIKTTNGIHNSQYFSWGYLKKVKAKIATHETHPEYFL